MLKSIKVKVKRKPAPIEGYNKKHKGLTIDRVLLGLQIQIQRDELVLQTLELPSWQKEYGMRWVKSRKYRLTRRVKAAKLLVELFEK